MAGNLAKLAAGVGLALLMVAPVNAAPDGRPVETETIIVPPDDGSRAMPSIPAPSEDDDATTGDSPAAVPDIRSDGPEAVPVVEYDPAKLPMPVRRLREQIIEAAASGDIEKLRPIIEANGEPPDFSFDEIGDPIDYLRSLSGDAEGREILAVLIDVLDAGYVHVDTGTSEEIYVWPYFARYPVDKLTPPQMVELFRIVFAGDYEDMKTYGAYISYRVGLTPDGRWSFFLAGD
ncbi:MAG: hypothetical protein K8F58_19130 [Bauldia sp.]|nr:hypothetical protein [Bauldia sp.]